MPISNIRSDDPQGQAQATSVELAATKLVTDSVAVVIDERRQQGELAITLDDLTDRLVLQFHNLPGFDGDDFKARANASVTIAALQPPSADRGTAKLDQAARKAESSHKKAS